MQILISLIPQCSMLEVIREGIVVKTDGENTPESPEWGMDIS
jgi:hypothetical protein